MTAAVCTDRPFQWNAPWPLQRKLVPFSVDLGQPIWQHLSLGSIRLWWKTSFIFLWASNLKRLSVLLEWNCSGILDSSSLLHWGEFSTLPRVFSEQNGLTYRRWRHSPVGHTSPSCPSESLGHSCLPWQHVYDGNADNPLQSRLEQILMVAASGQSSPDNCYFCIFSSGRDQSSIFFNSSLFLPQLNKWCYDIFDKGLEGKYS